MSLSITIPTNKEINGLQTNASAAILQLPSTLQRKDENGIRTTVSSGNEAFLVANSELYDIGDTLYFGRDEDIIQGSPSGLYTVESLPTATVVRTTNPRIGNNVDGFLNNLTTRENYEVNIKIVETDLVTPIINTNLKYTPRPDGLLFIDLGPIISEFMELNEIDSKEYAFEAFETWRGVEGPAVEGSGIVIDNGGFCQFSGPQTSEWPIGTEIYLTSSDGPLYNAYGTVTSHVDANNMVLSIAFIAVASIATIETLNTLTRSQITQAVLAKKQQFQQGGAAMWENLLVAGQENTPFSLLDFYNIHSEITENWFEFNASADGYPNSWRVNDIEQDNQSSLLTLDRYSTNGANLKITITYSCGVSNNVSGTVPLLIGSSVAGAMGTKLVPVSGPIATFEMTQLLPYDIPEIRFDIRPIDGRVDYFIINDMTITPTVGALLTKFKNPKIWKGWKRTIAVLMDSEFSTRVDALNPRVYQYEANINKVDGGFLSTEFIDQSIIGIYITRVLDSSDFFTKVYCTNNANDVNISEYLYFENKCTPKNPIMVQFRNSLAGTEQHLFSKQQNINNQAADGTQYESPVSWDLGIENARTKGRFNITSRQQILLQASQLTINQLEALNEIKESDEVSLFLTKDGAELLPVVVVTDFTTEYDNDGKFYDFSVLVELPDGVKFEDVKKY